MQLKQGSLLQGGKYKIERVLGQGGFGITYLAENTMLEGKVAIKEFFFKEYCDRDETTSNVTIGTRGNLEIVERFKHKFIKEARTIFKLNHPNIIHIHDIFEENDTAYYVMDYINGESLSNMVKRIGHIEESRALSYIKDVAKALEYIHNRNIAHLDIKPGNIMLRKEDQRILLIDFGISKHYDEKTFKGTTNTPVGISQGYSPAEQYLRNGIETFCPQSDVYSLAATLYKLISGVTPPEAMIVQDEGLPMAPLKTRQVSEKVISAIVDAMKTKKKRTQSISEFIANLSGPEEVTIEISTQKENRKIKITKQELPEINNPVPKPNLKKYIIAIVSTLVIIIFGILWWDNSKEKPVPVNIVSEYPIKANDGKIIYIWNGKLNEQGLPTGNGIATFYPNDEQGRKEYLGEMDNGMFESAKATLLYLNGSKFEGSFKNGQRENGTLTIEEDEMYYKGTFQDDKEFNGKWYYLRTNEIYSEVVNGEETLK